MNPDSAVILIGLIIMLLMGIFFGWIITENMVMEMINKRALEVGKMKYNSKTGKLESEDADLNYILTGKKKEV